MSTPSDTDEIGDPIPTVVSPNTETAQEPAGAADTESANQASTEQTLADAPDQQLNSEKPTDPAENTEAEQSEEPAPAVLAEQKYDVYRPRETGAPERVPLPPNTVSYVDRKIKHIPNIDTVVSPNQHSWVQTLRVGMSNLAFDDFYQKAITRPTSQYAQSLVHNGHEIRGVAPSFKSKPGTHEIEGETALLQLVSHLGVGGLFRVPLWNSGIWVTFKPATDSEMLELNRMLAADKIVMGRLSYGLALSSTTVVTLDRIFDFVLRHVYNTSVNPDEMPLSKLSEWIAPQDISSFIWGFLCANYPSGFHYATSCVANPDSCNYVIEETINVTKLQWIDRSELNEWQRAHMSSMQANAKKLDQIKRYREEFTKFGDRRISITEGSDRETGIVLRTPTVPEYIEQGYSWINGIVEAVSTSITGEDNIDRRNEEINKLSKATSLCQYSHWISQIEIVENKDSENQSTRIIKDSETISKVLAQISAIDSLREKIIDSVIEYINDTTISVIGIPTFECPSCGKAPEAVKTFPRHVSVIPLDLIQVFFELHNQRCGRAATR